MPRIRSCYRSWVSLAILFWCHCATWLTVHKRLLGSLLFITLISVKFFDLPTGPGDGPGWP